MRVNLILPLLLVLGMATAFAPHGRASEVNPEPFNRAPLKQKPYAPLPLGSVKAEGWLQDTLHRMADGMTGHLDELYGKVVGERNAWLGGNGDAWERGPYWIDGLLPLAHLLEDESLKKKVRPWIEYTLKHQRNDGYIGPRPMDPEPKNVNGMQRQNREDWWPRMVMLKILKNYYTATGDQRVIEALDKYFRYQLRTLPEKPLGKWTFWANRRGGDNLMVVLWFYNVTGKDYLLDLAKLIHEQTYPYTKEWGKPDSPLTKVRGMHCVNIAQGMKEPIIFYQLQPEQRHLEAVDKAFSDLDSNFGFPTGLYGADEPLHSAAPSVGSEFCTAVEMMFSLENMFAITGDVDFADRLERVAFNVVPTQATDEFTGRQYYSLVNQVMAVERERPAHFTDHGGKDIAYGVLTGYPCCTTNMHQGWPKFTQHLWMASADHGLAAVAYAPCRVTTEVAGGHTVTIHESGDYPFGETVRFQIETEGQVEFPLHLRIPDWCKNAAIEVNDEKLVEPGGGRMQKITRTWKDGDVVELRLPMDLRYRRWYNDSVAFERGPLVYALKIGERWKKVDAGSPARDFLEARPTTPWNYGILSSDLQKLDEKFEVRSVRDVGKNPWSVDTAPVEIEARGVRVPQWKLENRTATAPPKSPAPAGENPEPEPITLVPYGSTTLRIAEFPVATPGKIPLTQTARATVSHMHKSETTAALKDGIKPADSGDQSIPRQTFWPHKGSEEWLEYEWEEPKRVRSVSIYWFDDTGVGQCRTPASWRLLYREDGEWKEVETRDKYGTSADQYNTVTFDPVKTDALRLEVSLRDGFSGGVLEWKVE